MPLFAEIEESKYPRPEFQARVQKSFQSFADRCGKALQDISYRSIVSPIRWGVHQNMDITIFDVSKNEWDQRSFEIAFSNFREYVDNFSLQTERLETHRLIFNCAEPRLNIKFNDSLMDLITLSCRKVKDGSFAIKILHLTSTNPRQCDNLCPISNARRKVLEKSGTATLLNEPRPNMNS